MCMGGSGSTSAKSLRQSQLGVARRNVSTSRVAGYDLQKAGWYAGDKFVTDKSETNKDWNYGKGVKYGKPVKCVGRRISEVKDGATRSKTVADMSQPTGMTQANPLMPAQPTYAKKTVTQTYREAAYNPRMEDNANQRVAVDDGSTARKKSRVARSAVANANVQSRFSGKRSRSGGLKITTASSGVQVPGA